MSDSPQRFRDKRISVGAALAGVATCLVFFTWRFAAIFDAQLGLPGWLWLGFEFAILLAAFPFVALVSCGLGAFLVKRGPGTRWYSAASGGLVGLAFGLGFAVLGLYDIEVCGFLNSAPVGILAMTFSAVIGGYVGHAGWFPPPSVKE